MPLQFQYLSLIRFGAKVHEKALRLGNSLRLWEERKTEIVRSLSNVAPLREYVPQESFSVLSGALNSSLSELLSAGRRLLALGQDVSSIEAVLNSAGTSLVQDPHVYQRPGTQQYLPSNLLTRDNVTPPRPTLHVSSRLARGSAADLDRLTKGSPSLGHRGCGPANGLLLRDGYSAKRQRVESSSDLGQPFDPFPSSRPYAKVPSRDLMPPPPLPKRNPFVFMVNTDGPDRGNSNTGEARDEGAHERAASNTPQRQPPQESVRSSARRYTGTTQGSGTRYPSSASNASTAVSEAPARGEFINREQPFMQAQGHMNFHGPGRRPSIAETVASQPASITEISDFRASSASRNESVSRHISPHGPGFSSHSRASSSEAGTTSSRHFTPSRERTLGTPHRRQLGATSQTGSQCASNSTPSDENLRGRMRTPAQVPSHRCAPSEQSPGQSAETEDENLAQRTPRYQRRRVDR